MPQIEVQRLNYRGEGSLAGRVEFAVGDALQTEAPDDGRLILVRSLKLGPIGLSTRGAAHATATAWREALGTARHGGSSGAETANCVWFASAAEARIVLLRELARGRTPFAWFWALAVPDWQRMTLVQYLERRLGAALATSGEAETTALIDEAIAAGAAEALAATILAAISVGPAPAQGSHPSSPPSAARSDPRAPAGGIGETDAEADPELVQALDVMRAVPSGLRSMLEMIAARRELAGFAETLMRGFLLRRHPALALAPRRLAVLSQTVVRMLLTGEDRANPPAVQSTRSARSEGAFPADTGPRSRQPGMSPREDAKVGTGTASAPQTAPELPPSPIREAALAPQSEFNELASTAAGLFLVIVPLLRLGWREWLAAHPDLLVHQPGARLLRSIATHYHVPEIDAVWQFLPSVEDDREPPPRLAEGLSLWRAGLDGWLRRKPRLRLVDLVQRRGWIAPGPETTTIRFPLAEIDIRLRRLALDGDPGWVDWLGHSYRLVYRDRPLIGPRAG